MKRKLSFKRQLEVNDMKTLIGLFDKRENMEMAIEKFKAEGFNTQDFSIIMKHDKESEENSNKDLAGGAAAGAIIGGIAGLVGAITIPGLGAFLIGGPIASALGLTGLAAASFAGATTGALAGGLIGALTSLGLSRKDAQHYEEQVKTGAVLLAVPATDVQESFVKHIFQDYNAYDIKTIDQTSESQREETETEEPVISVREEHKEFDENLRPSMYMSGAKGGEQSIDESEKNKQPESEIKVFARKGDVIRIEIDEG